MGYRGIVLIVILVFGILFSFFYASSFLNYRIKHSPDAIPISPTVSQEQILAIVEGDYRKKVPGFLEAYLHFHYYNYSQGQEDDEEYQRFLRTIMPGWKLSEIKDNPSLLNLSLVFVHANGSIYRINSQSDTFEKVCDQPSIDCILGRYAELARDRLVYEVGAIVEGANGYDSDVHYIVDAETGRIVYHSPYLNTRPLPHRFLIDNYTQTVNELEQQRDNARFGATIEIVYNASEISATEGNTWKGFDPPDVILTLNNITEDALTITWFNHDTISHTVTSDDGYSDLLGNRLDSGLVESGESYAFVFIEEGPYQYHCRIHPWMKGSISIMPSDFY